MKHQFRLLVILATLMVITACGTSAPPTPTITPTASATHTPEATPTSTPTPTFTPLPSPTPSPSATATSPAAATRQSVPVYGYEIVAEHPHDPMAFTQGLVYEDGIFYEGTGQWGESTVRHVDIESGEVIQSVDIAPELFGEGITIWEDRVIQITWRSQVAFVYDKVTLEQIGQFSYETEGWGITHDGEQLIMSDGTDIVSFRDPDTFAVTGQIRVNDQGQPVTMLNELEYVEGEIWANLWLTDLIARIDPATGNVTGYIDLTGILPPELRSDDPDEVLNGIAYDPETGRIWVTGKRWPTMFEIRLVAP